MARQGQFPGAVKSPNDFLVELVTPKGKLLSVRASAFEFSAVNAVLQVERRAIFYFGSISSGELTLRLGTDFRFFAVFRASARMIEQHLTVVAEMIEPLSAPARAAIEPFWSVPPKMWRKLPRRAPVAKMPNEKREPRKKRR